MSSGKDHESMLRDLLANEMKKGPARIAETWKEDLSVDNFFAEHLPTLVNTKEVIHSPNSIQDIYRYPLSRAVESSKTTAVRFLLNAGADPNMNQGSGTYLLYDAYEDRNTEVFGLLLSNGASFEACC